MAKKKETLRDWFSKNKGTGWVDCKTGKPCGRKKGEKRAYPACRPTMAQCTSAAKKKKGPARISWKKKKKGRLKAATGGPITIRGQGIVMANRLR